MVTVAAAVCGKIEHNNAVAPINALSPIVWGDRAAAAETFSVRYTFTGLVLSSMACWCWAGLHHRLFGAPHRKDNSLYAFVNGTGSLAGGA
jgi:hypothetical protein